MLDLTTTIARFQKEIETVITQETGRIRENIIRSLGNFTERNTTVKLARTPIVTQTRARKTRKVVLCLRSGCKNVGAPIYGMVCTKHKDTPKAQIKKLRAAREAKKV